MGAWAEVVSLMVMHSLAARARPGSDSSPWSTFGKSLFASGAVGKYRQSRKDSYSLFLFRFFLFF